MHPTVLILCLTGMAAACVPPDCSRPDCGTCGVACCAITVRVQASEVELMQWLNRTLASGGPDGRFFLKPTAEDPYGAPALIHLQTSNFFYYFCPCAAPNMERSCPSNAP